MRERKKEGRNIHRVNKWRKGKKNEEEKEYMKNTVISVSGNSANPLTNLWIIY